MIRKIVAISILGACLAGNAVSAEEDDLVDYAGAIDSKKMADLP